MMRHVWKNYEQHAFGKDELRLAPAHSCASSAVFGRPVSGNGTDNWGGIGQTLVDALDTLWLMGFMEELADASLGFRFGLNMK